LMAFPFKGDYQYTSDTTGKLPWHPCRYLDPQFISGEPSSGVLASMPATLTYS